VISEKVAEEAEQEKLKTRKEKNVKREEANQRTTVMQMHDHCPHHQL
jgi:hypothetical protein